MKRVFSQIHRFGSVYGRLVLELFRFSPKWTVFIVVCQVLGPVLQPVIIVVLSKGVKLIQGDPIPEGSVFHPLLGALEPKSILLLLSAALVVLGIAGAVLGWLGASGARKLGRLYRLNLTEKIFEKIATSPVGAIRLPAELAGEDSLQKVIVSYGLKLNLAVICLFSAIRHGFSTALLAASLVYINGTLSMIFFAIAILVLPFYFLLNRKTHAAAKSWHVDGGARDAAVGLLDLAKLANRLPEGGEDPPNLDYSREIHENSSILENLETMEFGRLAGAKSQLYSQLFRAVFLGGALYLFGLIAMNPSTLTWDSLVVFLIAASMLQISISGFSSSLSMLSWHSPPVAMIGRYRDALFREIPERKKRAGSSATKAKPYRNALVVSPVSLGRTSFHLLMNPLVRHGVIEEFQASFEYHTLSLKGVPRTKWKEVASSMEGQKGIIFVELGALMKLEKLSKIQECELSNSVVFTNSWEESLDLFDLIIRISEDGNEEAGPPSYWEGRDDLKEASNKGAGMLFDLEEIM
jgi:ABC-type multidrug transport system fused ATPase/permease subunit